MASIESNDVGLATIVTHSPYAAEVHVIGVRPVYHHRGVGSRMLRFAEKWLATQGVEFLQVKTLSPRRPDPNYERTRAFYLAYGFRPLEEFPLLWGPDNPALQLVKVVT